MLEINNNLMFSSIQSYKYIIFSIRFSWKASLRAVLESSAKEEVPSLYFSIGTAKAARAQIN
jgi:hypothetical protein